MTDRIKTVLLTNRVLVFPVILLMLLIVLSYLRISGTSIGIYHDYLFGESSRDSSLLAGRPQSIRSDEWLINTQYTIAQEKIGYKLINPNINWGNDMSLIVDVPYIDWSALFKPQNFSFFVVPLEYAFSFKWWSLLFSLIVSLYFFCLRLLPGRITFAIASSIVLACSPFVFWWYQTITIAPLCYGILISLVCMSVVNKTELRLGRRKISTEYSLALKIVALVYLLTSFALVLYPPFQIPVAIVVTFFVLGYFFQNTTSFSWRDVRSVVFASLIAVSVTAAVCGAFVLTRGDAIKAITNTVYPGARNVASGGYDIKRLLVTYLQPQLQRSPQGNHYLTNQSESSSFILLPIFFLIPMFSLIVWYKRQRGKYDWVLVSLAGCSVLFLADLFIPGIDFITRLFLLHLVPHERVLIGLGFLSIILAIYLAKFYAQYVILTKRFALIVLVYSALFLAVVIWSGIETSHTYPQFISSKKMIILLAVISTSGLSLILLKKYTFGMIVLSLLSLASIIYINPLYVGLGPIYNSPIGEKISSISKPSDKWGSAQDIYIENLPQMSGRSSITGAMPYPNIAFWKQYTGIENRKIYNRYASVVLDSNDSASLILVGPDLIAVSASCSRNISRYVDYIISTTPLSGSCRTLLATVTYPMKKFYFYKSQ